MAARYQAYPEYKDSGLEWLGDLPEHWLCKKLKWEISARSGVDEKNDNGSFDLYGANGLIGATNTTSIVDNHGTVVVGRVGSAGSVNYIPYKSGVSDNALIINNYKFDCPRFDYYLLVSLALEELVSKNAQPLITATNIRDIKTSVTNCLSERQIIADFLDHETAKIDRLIEKQQQLITLLKEKRQAVISHAVTKGLNPDAPMRDSGVEWLGEVPAHWVIAQLKFNTLEIQTGPFGSQLHADDYVINGIPLINPAHIITGKIVPDNRVSVDEKTQDRLSRYKLCEGEIIFARRGELGRCAIVNKNQEGWLCGTGSLKAQLSARLIPEYAYLLITSEGVVSELSLESKGSTMDNLNTETLGRVRIPVPPNSEQNDILQYVESIAGKYEKLIKNSEYVIELLQERRTALISAAVTGKIDVRHWQA
ncbi:MAG: restriction endonuclease subunit S [bacterium]